jgi:hypothetical protein
LTAANQWIPANPCITHGKDQIHSLLIFSACCVVGTASKLPERERFPPFLGSRNSSCSFLTYHQNHKVGYNVSSPYAPCSANIMDFATVQEGQRVYNMVTSSRNFHDIDNTKYLNPKDSVNTISNTQKVLTSRI